MSVKVKLFKNKLVSLFFIVLLLGGSMACSIGGKYIGSHYYKLNNFFDNEKIVALAEAADRGDVKKVDQLVSQGVDVNTIGKEDMTLLLWVILTKPVNLAGLEALLRHGANPNFIAKNGETAGMSVTGVLGGMGNDMNALELVLKYGGNPNIRDPFTNNIMSNNTTALIQAAQHGKIENIKMLLKYGADINLADGFELTPLLEAASERHFDIAYYLLQQGADYKKFGYRPIAFRHTADFRYGIVEVIQDSLHACLSDERVLWRDKIIKWLEERGIKIPPRNY